MRRLLAVLMVMFLAPVMVLTSGPTAQAAVSISTATDTVGAKSYDAAWSWKHWKLFPDTNCSMRFTTSFAPNQAVQITPETVGCTFGPNLSPGWCELGERGCTSMISAFYGTTGVSPTEPNYNGGGYQVPLSVQDGNGSSWGEQRLSGVPSGTATIPASDFAGEIRACLGINESDDVASYGYEWRCQTFKVALADATPCQYGAPVNLEVGVKGEPEQTGSFYTRKAPMKWKSTTEPIPTNMSRLFYVLTKNVDPEYGYGRAGQFDNPAAPNVIQYSNSAVGYTYNIFQGSMAELVLNTGTFSFMWNVREDAAGVTEPHSIVGQGARQHEPMYAFGREVVGWGFAIEPTRSTLTQAFVGNNLSGTSQWTVGRHQPSTCHWYYGERLKTLVSGGVDLGTPGGPVSDAAVKPPVSPDGGGGDPVDPPEPPENEGCGAGFSIWNPLTWAESGFCEVVSGLSSVVRAIRGLFGAIAGLVVDILEGLKSLFIPTGDGLSDAMSELGADVETEMEPWLGEVPTFGGGGGRPGMARAGAAGCAGPTIEHKIFTEVGVGPLQPFSVCDEPMSGYAASARDIMIVLLSVFTLIKCMQLIVGAFGAGQQIKIMHSFDWSSPDSGRLR